MTIYWLWLTMVPLIGPVTGRLLLDQVGSPETIYQAGEEKFRNLPGLSDRQIKSLLENRSLEKAERIMDICKQKKISLMCLADLEYPERAKTMKDAPLILYFKGHPRKMEKTVGIVGARRCRQEAKRKAVFVSEEYTKNGFAVISGMAKGIDSYAHTACLNMGGYTVAVAGNGLDICYPCEHRSLMERIEETGLLISEYPPGTPPSRYHFPRRNRIISAWSDRLLVIEPGKGSGTLTTMEYEKKYGREVIIQKSLTEEWGQTPMVRGM